MVITFLKLVVEVVKGVVEFGIVDMDFERIDSNSRSLAGINTCRGGGQAERMYHTAYADCLLVGRIALPGRFRTLSRT